MGWQDRVRQGAYTAPGGSRGVFDFEGVGRDVGKRTAAFDFPGVDATYIQDNGHGGMRFPLRCFFAGDDHDVEAAEFERALLERGAGRLEHPLYGDFDVVPGQITRRDDLKEAANQTIIEVVFAQTVTSLYPEVQSAPRSDVEAAVEAFEEAAAEQFESSADLSTTTARATMEARSRGLMADVRADLRDVAAESSKVSDAFRDAYGALDLGMSVLVRTPAALAASLVSLTTLPARSAAGVFARLDAYGALLDRLITAPTALPAASFVGGTVLPGRRRTVSNDFHLTSVFAASAVVGSVVSVVETTFRTRPEAIAAAERLSEQLATLVAWMDAGFAALGDVDAPGGLDTGGTYQAVQDAVALGAGYLVEISFSLLPERRIVLGRPRTVIDLAAELYGAVDSRLDFLIESNGLSGSELLELPRDRTLVYYA